MAARTPLMAGNWKMNLDHLEAIAHVQKLAFTLSAEDLDAVEVAVLVPYTDIRSVQTLVEGERLRIGYGAQNLSQHEKGAHTGDISGAMLARLGCGYVIVGHSERRTHHGETDEHVAAKVAAAFRNGMVPILCVGEPLDAREAGTHVEHVLSQLRFALREIAPEQARALVVAYEPVWAIGTGKVATPEDAQEVCAAIRTCLAERYSPDLADGVRVIYGGSVKADNIAPIMAEPDIDGALVGGASLDVDEFAGIVRYRLARP